MPEINWPSIANTFAPFQSVPPDKLNDWFVTRFDSPLEVLVNELSPERLPQRIIFVGQPASGKSSELTKLASELKSRYKALVVRVDMTNNLDVERAHTYVSSLCLVHNCIVNGPGEMADADYGYVGKQPGFISLYRGREEVKKVPETQGVEELINLIKTDGRWVDPA